MDRSFSLRRDDFQRVWDDGTSYSHPLVILRVSANGMSHCRFGFVAGKKVGKAVMRNRAKRWMREAIQHRLPTITPGWDLILIARGNAVEADFQTIVSAIDSLLQRAQLVVDTMKFLALGLIRFYQPRLGRGDVLAETGDDCALCRVHLVQAGGGHTASSTSATVPNPKPRMAGSRPGRSPSPPPPPRPPLKMSVIFLCRLGSASSRSAAPRSGRLPQGLRFLPGHSRP